MYTCPWPPCPWPPGPLGPPGPPCPSWPASGPPSPPRPACAWPSPSEAHHHWQLGCSDCCCHHHWQASCSNCCHHHWQARLATEGEGCACACDGDWPSCLQQSCASPSCWTCPPCPLCPRPTPGQRTWRASCSRISRSVVQWLVYIVACWHDVAVIVIVAGRQLHTLNAELLLVSTRSSGLLDCLLLTIGLLLYTPAANY